MRLTGEVVAKINGIEYLFALRGRQIEQLEYDEPEGISTVERHINLGEASFNILHSVLLYGLEGGGLNMLEARKNLIVIKAATSMHDRFEIARLIIAASWHGVSRLLEDNPPSEGSSGGGSGNFNVASWRGKLASVGCDPAYCDNHSIYEILSTFIAASKDSKGGEMSDETYDNLLDALAERKLAMGLL